MAYVEHEWVNGETITAEKMNNIEEGIAEAAQSGGDKYAPYDFVIWNHYDENSGDWIYEAVKGTFAELKTALLSGALVVGLSAYTYVSGDWVETQFTDTLWVQYNPPRDAVVIRGVVCASTANPSQLYLAWNSDGIFYDD